MPVTALLILLNLSSAWAQPAIPSPREFPIGSLQDLSQLPAGRFKTDLEQLPPEAKGRALQWLRSFHFTDADLASLKVDPEGGIFYICDLKAPSPAAAPAAADPVTSAAAVPVSPFPSQLIFHSRPGAPNVLFINFSGEYVTGTAWNASPSPAAFSATAFSTDADFTTFSDAEQVAIKRVWLRMAEDYAPFNIDVTTERPATFTTRTAMALITRNTGTDGVANPASSAGGVAYVNAFGLSNYGSYRPAWIYYNNLANDESYISEAASHEVGHNLGLSHDGISGGAEYYGGHGSGDTSWGPIMGTGYRQNVSQWSKGEYYLPSNTEDDLAIIAGKIAYRADDRGNTAGTATALALTGGTNIVATTPYNDPTNANPANKGVLERNTDVDVYSFVTGSGPVVLSVNPWIMPAGTRGGNLDVSLELYNEAGVRLLTNNPPTTTTASIQNTLAQGKYYLWVRNSGAGNPTNPTPSGYSAYGSLGQYFISGRIVAASAYTVPPVAELQPIAGITLPGQGALQFAVSYSDNVAIDVAGIDGADVRVTGPNGYSRAARLVSVDNPANGTPRVATYAADPPQGAAWLSTANGSYTVWMQTNQVRDTEGAYVPAGQLGGFTVDVPAVLYSATMDTDPGWTLEPQWAYGVPADPSGGPTSGFTGTQVIGYNLTGPYAKNLAAKYATTPVINCAGSSSLTLRFKRWLQANIKDPVSIQVSTNSTTWTDVWSDSSGISDSSWQTVQYTLPAGAAGSPAVRLRWSQASGPGPGAQGWNIDDVELLAGGGLDAAPPVAALSVGNITAGGSPSQSCSVTYTDNTAVRLASLGQDLVVTGPSSYSNLVDFAGADLPGDGSPVTASYSIAAPGGVWEAADNGTYSVRLLDNEVEDIYNNRTPGSVLGTFTVSIAAVVPTVELAATVNVPAWGSVSPGSGTYPAGSAVQLLAAPAQYFQFGAWSGAVSGTNNPLGLVLQTNTAVTANFAEIMTVAHPTPYWWLAAYGYTTNFEAASLETGVNGIPRWQSYIAGLNPNDAQSRLLLHCQLTPNGTGIILNWSTVSNRFYTLWSAASLAGGFAPVAGATNLPWTVPGFTNTGNGSAGQLFRLEVKKP